MQILLQGAPFNLGGTTVNAVVACSASMAARELGSFAGFGRWLNRVSALVFLGLAVKLAVAEQH